jgi:hypothetical protein
MKNTKKKSVLELQNLINANKKNLNDIIQQKELEIKEINLNHAESMKNELEHLKGNYEKIINEINNENNNLRQDNIILVQKINNIEEISNEEKDKCNKNIKSLENENDSRFKRKRMQ